MNESEICDLFADGTAPERDADFALRVAAGIGRARLRTRLLEISLRAALVVTLSVAAFAASDLIKPLLTPLIDGSSQLMGVPVPVVLGAAVAGLALRYLRPLAGFAPPAP